MPNPTPSSDFPGRPNTSVHAGMVLADGETIAWKGRPSALGIARQALFADWILCYFAMLGGVGIARAALGQAAYSQALRPLAPALVVGVIMVALAVTIARSTSYIITDRRLIIRYGAALPRSLSVPLSQVRSLSLSVGRNGRGDIAFATKDTMQVPVYKLWPHVRSAGLSGAEPRFRDVPDAALLATRLTRALHERDAGMSHPLQRPLAA